MTINVRKRQDVTILDLSVDLVLPEGYDSVRNQVKELLAARKKRILLNLAQVDYMDSGDLGVLIESLVSTRKRSGQLKLVNVSCRDSKTR